LLPNPAPPRSRHVGSMSLGCAQAFFFKSEVMAIEKSPERSSAARNPLLVHRRQYLVQSPIRVLGSQSKDALRVVF